jgi:glycosyltransferase involved in cell wall biosynthesis
MAAFDVYVNCSTYEGVSLTILEAMATALPVIATAVGGNPEVVVDQETGLLVDERPRSLATAIATLAANPAQRQDDGRRGTLARQAPLHDRAHGQRLTRPRTRCRARASQAALPAAPANDPATCDTKAANPIG